jgi:hypothetical protein
MHSELCGVLLHVGHVKTESSLSLPFSRCSLRLTWSSELAAIAEITDRENDPLGGDCEGPLGRLFGGSNAGGLNCLNKIL